jgi:hypothetical protein
MGKTNFTYTQTMTFLITAIFYRTAIVKQDHYMAHLLS